MSTVRNLLPKDGRAYLYPDFFSARESRDILKSLQKEISWQHQAITLFGKKILQPRLTAWMSDDDVLYKYSGLLLTPNEWQPQVLEIKNRVESLKKSFTFNSALLNLYRNGQDSMGWHQDNEKELGKNPTIASVTFGEPRRFQFRHKQDPKLKVSIELPSGSLLIMSGATQHHWQHALPKTKLSAEPRLNITFRNIKSKSDR